MERPRRGVSDHGRIEIPSGSLRSGYNVSERTTAGGITFPSVLESLGGDEKITYQSIAVGEPTPRCSSARRSVVDPARR